MNDTLARGGGSAVPRRPKRFNRPMAEPTAAMPPLIATAFTTISRVDADASGVALK